MHCIVTYIIYLLHYLLHSVTNPLNGAVIGSVPDMNAADAEAAVQAAYKAFQTWKKTTAKVVYNFLKPNYYSAMKIMHYQISKFSLKPKPKHIGVYASLQSVYIANINSIYY